MLEEIVYKISELRSLKESTNETKPVIGNGVTRTDARNNEKAVNDIMKQVKDYDNVGESSKKRDTNKENVHDLNKTTLDVKFAYEPSDEYKKRVKSQVKGYSSVEDEKNTDKDESVDREGNEEFYDEHKKLSKEKNAKETDLKHAGLKSHNLDKEDFKNHTIYKNESKKMKRLHFKNTTFLSEEHMLKKVPDDYKKDGNKFVMKDASDNEYLVECKVDDRFNFTKLTVLGKFNKTQINEELDKIKKLYDYNSSDYFKTMDTDSRLNESKNMGDMINIVKKLEEKK